MFTIQLAKDIFLLLLRIQKGLVSFSINIKVFNLILLLLFWEISFKNLLLTLIIFLKKYGIAKMCA